MGKQSSRIVKLNSDHKDISNNGVSHFQLWHNGELLWEKLADEEEDRDYDFALTAKPSGLSARPANFQIKGNVTIDWGDGTIQNVNASYLTKVQRVYSSSGLYVIKISGNIEDMSFYNSQGIYSINTPFPGTMKDKTDFTEMFYTDANDIYHSTYAGGFPKKLFSNMVNATNFTKCFCGVKDLALPKELFKNCKKAETFDYCFQSCTFAEELPSDIFEYSINAKTFIGTFYNSVLIVPQNMFTNCLLATDFTECFSGAEITSSVVYPIDYYSNKPVDYLDNMFYGLANVVSFARCFDYANLHGGFIEGTSTLSWAILGDNFFGGCVLAENFEWCFHESTGIKNVSEKLFDDCTHANNFLSTFFDCTEIESNVPELWERDNVETFSGCYSGCTNAQNYADIPDAWK